MTQVVSIFERIGLGGGGKVKAVFHRLNALCEIEGAEPVLLNLHHGAQQRMNFAQLQADGVLAPGVRQITLPDALAGAARAAGIAPFDGLPGFDRVETRDDGRLYWDGRRRVMVDRDSETPAGIVTRRTFPGAGGQRHCHLIDGALCQMVQRRADGTVDCTDYAEGRPVRWTRRRKGRLIMGRNLLTGVTYRQERGLTKSLVEMMDWDGTVVFFDGVTSAYLSAVTGKARVLFLHADHRAPGGGIVPQSRFLIENFGGEAIVTSTRVHKARMEAELTPAAPVHVIPHFCDIDARPEGPRRNLVTVSRLELNGKPIHECIEAFGRIAGDVPDVDYLIFGLGAGEEALRRQIKKAKLDDRVRLMGYSTEVAEVFRGAIASVYPTMTEGFGLSILEALSCGCPVISYDVDYGPREMIVPGVNGELVAPGDIDAIAGAMRQVLGAPARYQAAARQGLERYSRARYLDGYREMVARLSGTVAGLVGGPKQTVGAD